MSDADLQVWTTSDGYTRCLDPETGEIVSVDRLTATLIVEDLDQLDGRDVHHRLGWPATLGPESLAVLDRSEHVCRHRDGRVVSPATITGDGREAGDGPAPDTIADMASHEVTVGMDT